MMKETKEIQIAETILNQVGRNAMMCVGARNSVLLKETETRQAGLRFQITIVLQLRTWISIELNWNDTYTVRLITRRRRQGRHVFETETHEDVYCDMLSEMVYQLGLRRDIKNNRTLELGAITA